MTPEEIKRRLKQKRITQVDLAKRYKVSQNAISYLIRGTLTSRRLEMRLARLMGMTLDEFRAARSQPTGPTEAA